MFLTHPAFLCYLLKCVSEKYQTNRRKEIGRKGEKNGRTKQIKKIERRQARKKWGMGVGGEVQTEKNEEKEVINKKARMERERRQKSMVAKRKDGKKKGSRK